MSKLPALDIMKAAPQHADRLGSSGIAMLVAIAAQWDSLGCATAVCWPNSRLGEKSGLSKNSVPAVRQRLIDLGWLVYTPMNRMAGLYIPKLPDYQVQTGDVDCASGCTLTVQTVCDDCARTVTLTVQTVLPYKPVLSCPSPVLNTNAVEIPPPPAAPEAKVSKPRTSPEQMFIKKHLGKIMGTKSDRVAALRWAIGEYGMEDAETVFEYLPPEGVWYNKLAGTMAELLRTNGESKPVNPYAPGTDEFLNFHVMHL